MAEEIAVLGGGCFWCVEAIFQKIKGINQVISGYSDGQLPNPTYKDICTGTTGHAEVVEITFDPSEISYADLLYIFFRTHNPTTLNQQHHDKGTQYRSIILTTSDRQTEVAKKVIAETEKEEIWEDPIVTEITPLTKFYPAEDYHQNYYQSNRYQPYCVSIIDPKMQSFYKKFPDKISG